MLVGIIAAGGVLGPLLLLTGLARVSGLVGALVLNLEAPFTSSSPFWSFGEHLGFREAGAAASHSPWRRLRRLAAGRELTSGFLGVAAIAGGLSELGRSTTT